MSKQAQQYAAFVLCVGMFVCGLVMAGNEISGYADRGFSIYIPASAGVPLAGDAVYMAGGTLTTSGVFALAADGATDEDTTFFVQLPASYDSASDLNITLFWSSEEASASVEWEVSVGTLTGEDLKTIVLTSIVDTLIEFTDTSNGTAGIPSYTTVAVANSLIDAAAASDVLVILVNRDASADSSNVDSKLIGIGLSQ